MNNILYFYILKSKNWLNTWSTPCFSIYTIWSNPLLGDYYYLIYKPENDRSWGSKSLSDESVEKLLQILDDWVDVLLGLKIKDQSTGLSES